MLFADYAVVNAVRKVIDVLHLMSDDNNTNGFLIILPHNRHWRILIKKTMYNSQNNKFKKSAHDDVSLKLNRGKKIKYQKNWERSWKKYLS